MFLASRLATLATSPAHAILGAAIAGEALTAIQMIGFALALSAMLAGQLSPTGKEPTA